MPCQLQSHNGYDLVDAVPLSCVNAACVSVCRCGPVQWLPAHCDAMHSQQIDAVGGCAGTQHLQ